MPGRSRGCSRTYWLAVAATPASPCIARIEEATQESRLQEGRHAIAVAKLGTTGSSGGRSAGSAGGAREKSTRQHQSCQRRLGNDRAERAGDEVLAQVAVVAGAGDDQVVRAGSNVRRDQFAQAARCGLGDEVAVGIVN